MELEADVDVSSMVWVDRSNATVTALAEWGLEWVGAKQGKMLFLSVSFANPKAAKKLRQGSLVASDVGICIHSVLNIFAGGIWVATTPINVQLAGGPDVDVGDGSALLLHVDAFSFEQLKQWRKWSSKGLKHILDHNGLGDLEPPTQSSLDDQAEVCERILGIGDDVGGAGKPQLEGGAAAFSGWLQDKGLVSPDMRFSPEAEALVRTAWDLKLEDEKCLAVRGIPTQDMTRFELMEVLDSRGWSCKLCRKKKEVRTLLDPYVDGETQNKFWFLQVQKDKSCLKNLCVWYLRCLVDVNVHQQPVPHFQKAETYRKLLDPSWIPKAKHRRRREVKVGEEDWEGVQELRPAAQQRRAAKRAPQRQRLPHDEPADAGSDSGKSDSDGGSSTTDSDSSDSSKKSSNSSNSSNSSSGSSSSSESNSSSNANGDNDSEQQGEEQKEQEPVAPAMPARKLGGRISANRVPLGTCWLTPRFEGQVSAQSWQVLCDNPDHNREGRCTKEHRVATAGSEDVCIRRLKTWVVRGRTPGGTRADHRKLWKQILDLSDGNGLPTMSELDAAAPGDLDVAVAAQGGDDHQPNPKRRRLRSKGQHSQE